MDFFQPLLSALVLGSLFEAGRRAALPVEPIGEENGVDLGGQKKGADGFPHRLVLDARVPWLLDRFPFLRFRH